MATYKDSGVDVDAGNEAVKRIKGHVKSTFSSDVLFDVGAFGGAVSAAKLKEFEEPVLISSIDSVGTKTKVNAMMDSWESAGKDMIGHSCNDIAACGAMPWFFLDYLASSRLSPDRVEQIVKGLAEGCKENGMSLVAGEVAEMPGVYLENEVDIVGCVVGIVEKGKIVDGSRIQEGDALISLRSSGLHTNGFSLARKALFEMAGFDVNDKPEQLDCSVGKELLKPHKSYSNTVAALMKEFGLHGIAHITGGGLIDNVGRLLPEGLGAKIAKQELRPQPIFGLIQEKGEVPEQDMFRTFNMGSGMVLIVKEEEKEAILEKLNALGEEAWEIGKIEKGKGVEIT